MERDASLSLLAVPEMWYWPYLAIAIILGWSQSRVEGHSFWPRTFWAAISPVFNQFIIAPRRRRRMESINQWIGMGMGAAPPPARRHGIHRILPLGLPPSLRLCLLPSTFPFLYENSSAFPSFALPPSLMVGIVGSRPTMIGVRTTTDRST